MKLRRVVEEAGFEVKKADYAHFAATKNKCSLTYYQSGKVVVQGKDAKEFVEFHLEPEVLGQARLGYEKELNPQMFAPHFGIDEAGKGDFFGPMVVAGAYVNEDIADKLIGHGIRDSKTVTTDKRIQDLADLIRDVVGHRCEVIAIGPERYNQLHRKFRTVNKLLAWGHGKVIENLHAKVPDCPRALSDQFAAPELIESELKAKKIDLILEQRTKAESDIAVAAASILAREKYVLALKELGSRLGVTLPKGSGTPASEMGEKLFKEKGEDVLRTVAKAHFRTFEIVCGRPAPEKTVWRKRL